MPFTVITLSRVPNSLRGDLSKWMQEIATGVYIGNFNSRVREQLWQRVCENLKMGEATLSYASRNELGYIFDTYQTKQKVLNMDGLSLVRYPIHTETEDTEEKYGFSRAYQSHMIHKMERSGKQKENQKKLSVLPDYILMDLETTGLHEEKNQIIEIGLLKLSGGKREEFHSLIQIDGELPESITELTGITREMLKRDGIKQREAMLAFMEFVGNTILVGYNIKFDIRFLKMEFQRLGLEWKERKYIDILSLVKKEKMFLDNYKLPTVLTSYGIAGTVPHRALGDVEFLLRLLPKLKGFEAELQRKA